MQPAASVWARCDRADHPATMAHLTRRLAEDGDLINLVTTLPQTHPSTQRAHETLLEAEQVALVLWLGGSLSRPGLKAAARCRVPVVLIDADLAMLRSLGSGFLSLGQRKLLQSLHFVFATDLQAAEAFVRAGARAEKVEPLGPLETGTAVLPFADADRQDAARALDTRPVWLARSVDLADIEMLTDAHRFGARRSHRLMLILIPHNRDDGPAMQTAARALGYTTHLRSAGDDPEDSTQIYIADLEGEDGLWLRIAPVCFAGGSVSRGAVDDPAEAAALGSVVIHGNAYGPHAQRFERLLKAGASYAIAEPAELGRAVESLLSADRVARMAMAGWDVTSSGAELTNRLIELIQQRLDGVAT